MALRISRRGLKRLLLGLVSLLILALLAQKVIHRDGIHSPVWQFVA